VKKLLAAVKYLTIWNRFTDLQPALETIGAAAFFFPLVGLVLGLLLATTNYLLAVYLDPEILSIALITTLIIATGGIHLEGLKHTFDSTAATTPVPRENETLGFVAIVLVILFKIGAADSMDEKLAVSLLLTPVFARWALVIFIYGSHHLCEEMPRRITENVKLWHLIVTTAATLTLAVYFLGRRGLWIGLSLSLFTLLTRTLLHRRHAVLTHDNFGAVIELGEVLSLILLASL
jgi:adenosylcobinamide-GDP ribazoletransferase